MQSNHFQHTRFLSSAVDCNQYPPDYGREIAIIGRSNSGKSSTINAVCTRTKLAKISKTPGRTRTINFFEVIKDKRIVDLPGYGYAQVSARERKKWSLSITQYFTVRNSLQGVIIVMDARRPLMQSDWQVIGWLDGIAFHVLLNKADKLKYHVAMQNLKATSAALVSYHSTVQLFSARDKQGVEQARNQLSQWLGM